MNTNTNSRFRSGEMLVVSPADKDDPDANALAGQTCKFIRWAQSPGALANYAVVQFSENGKPRYLRERDVVRKET